ncbi:ASTRA complex subunit [Tulasnella sp. 331]|nr:ASTRA complex subunit [Tulasnella sp. 331]
MPPPPPSPIRLLRSHSAQVNVICFSSAEEGDTPSNERLYTGDADGLVVVTSTRSFRALASWKAHNEGVLGIEEWQSSVLTHGRDNKIHAWTRISTMSHLTETASQKDLVVPELLYSLDVNALNFCRFSLLPMAGTAKGEALLAVPNLIESSLVDIWHLPSRRRLHAAIGKVPGSIVQDPWDTLGRGNKHTGLIMSLHIMSLSHPSSSKAPQLRILAGYENGGVCLWAYVKDDDVSIEGRGWHALWQVKAHVESVMGLALAPSHNFAISISADHLIARYSLSDEQGQIVEVNPDDINTSTNFERVVTHKTKYPGNGSVTIRPDGKVFAVGSWDGKIRLYSTKSFKTLGTLSYHTGGCQALAFAHPDASVTHVGADAKDEDNFGSEEREKRSRWLASGSVDRRVAIWELLTFAQK